MRTFNSGGAPCPVEVIEEFERRMAVRQRGIWAVRDLAGHSFDASTCRRKPGTIGLASPTRT